MTDMPKSDWRYLHGLIDALIERASWRMNQAVAEVLARTDLTERAKRVRVETLAKEHHRIIRDCFNDWSRSQVWFKCRLLVGHGMIEEDDLGPLTLETAEHIRSMFHEKA
jgi:hypothetical protein